MTSSESLLDADAALAAMLAAARRVKGRDQVALAEAAGRILAETLPAPPSALPSGIPADAAVLPAHRPLDAQAIALAKSLGLATLPVYRRLSVGLVSIDATATESASPDSSANRPMLAALLTMLGCTVEDLGHVADDYSATRKALLKAGNLHDLVITSGGLAANGEAPLPRAIANLGEIRLWGRTHRADGRLLFGKAGDADFIGLPGAASAAFMAFVLLARPFIRACQGMIVPDMPTATALADGHWDTAIDEALRGGDPMRLIALADSV